DGINDVEMIRDAHLGVAMLNGVDEVKAVCKDMTKYSHDEDGIARYLLIGNRIGREGVNCAFLCFFERFDFLGANLPSRKI
ncbi:MAG: HAD hydrolase family protein, partial [Cephaloticoccus sp.]|nr:HAD hydrolase family protein [Cephaloticoccus sp.]